jgi:hypothetical protein
MIVMSDTRTSRPWIRRIVGNGGRMPTLGGPSVSTGYFELACVLKPQWLMPRDRRNELHSRRTKTDPNLRLDGWGDHHACCRILPFGMLRVNGGSTQLWQIRRKDTRQGRHFLAFLGIIAYKKPSRPAWATNRGNSVDNPPSRVVRGTRGSSIVTLTLARDVGIFSRVSKPLLRRAKGIFRETGCTLCRPSPAPPHHHLSTAY